MKVPVDEEPPLPPELPLDVVPPLVVLGVSSTVYVENPVTLKA